jgi:hypothetical protein
LFRHLLLQIGGANIEDPTSSSFFAYEKRVRSSLLRSSGARFALSDGSLRSLRFRAGAAALFVVARGRKSMSACSSSRRRRAKRVARSMCIAAARASRAMDPTSSSFFADEKRVRSSLLRSSGARFADARSMH